MPWRRITPLVVFGAMLSGVLGAVLGAPVAAYLREGIATAAPKAASDRLYIAVVDCLSYAVCALPGVYVAVRAAAWRRAPAPNRCRQCGYDLTGNTSGRCPECGERS